MINTPRGDYAGCYENAVNGTGVSLFSGPGLVDQTNLTLESCQAFCTNALDGPYRFFGIESGIYCRCSNDFQHGAVAYDGTTLDCDTPCSGDNSQRCGAFNRMSVYVNNDFLALPVQVSPEATPVLTPISSPVQTAPVQSVPVSTPIAVGPGVSAGPIQSTPIQSVPVSTPIAVGPGVSAGPIQTTPISTPVVTTVPNADDVDAIDQTPGVGSSTPVSAPAVPTLPIRPLPQPEFPVRPPSVAGDGVDAPYFNNAPYAPLPRPLPNNPPSAAGDGVDAPYFNNAPYAPPRPIPNNPPSAAGDGVDAPYPNAPNVQLPRPIPNNPPSPAGDGVDAPYFNNLPNAPNAPLGQPLPNNPPSAAGDGVDAPYQNNPLYAPRPRPVPNTGARPQPRPQPQPAKNVYPVQDAVQASPRPATTWRPRQGGIRDGDVKASADGYRVNPVAARSERRWFGMW